MKKNYYTLFCRLSVFCLVGFYLLFVSIKTFGDSNPPESNIIVCDACGDGGCECPCKGNDHNKNCGKFACGHRACTDGDHDVADCHIGKHFKCDGKDHSKVDCKSCGGYVCQGNGGHNRCGTCDKRGITPSKICVIHAHCGNPEKQCYISDGSVAVGHHKCAYCFKYTCDGHQKVCGKKLGNNATCTRFECDAHTHIICPGSCKLYDVNHKCRTPNCNFYQCEDGHAHAKCRGGCGKNDDCPTKCKNNPSCSRLECEPGATHVKQACGRHNECEACRCKDDDNDHGHGGNGNNESSNCPNISSEGDSIPPVVNRGLSVRLIINDSESFADHAVKAQMNVKKNGNHYYATGRKGCCGHSNVSMVLAEGEYEIEFSVEGKCSCSSGYHRFVPEVELRSVVGEGYGYVVKEMSPSNGTAMSNTTKVLCRLSVFKIDLQIDSNNDEIIDEEDDKVEEDAPGSIIVCSHGDFDKDNIPDYADNQIVGGDFFKPLKVTAAYVDSNTKIKFNYEQTPWSTSTLPVDGKIRLWKKKSSDLRSSSDLIENGKLYELSEFTMTEGSFYLYVEGTHGGVGTISIETDGPTVVSDKVHYTTVELFVTQMAFNHDSNGHSTDGMNLRESVSLPKIEAPEWVDANRDLDPEEVHGVLYKRGISPVIYTRFEVKPAGVVSSMEIEAEGLRHSISGVAGLEGLSFGDLSKKTITFDASGISSSPKIIKSISGYEQFMTTKTTSSTITREEAYFNWKVSSVTLTNSAGSLTPQAAVVASRVTGKSQMTQPGTTWVTPNELVIYTIWDDPQAPWDVNVETKMPWQKGLDFAMDSNYNFAGINNKTDLEFLSSLTTFLHSGHGMVYDVEEGESAYIDGLTKLVQNTKLDSYIDKTDGPIVNCYDQAANLSAVAQLFGLKTETLFLLPFGYIPETVIVGNIPTNNPFYNNPAFKQPILAQGPNGQLYWYLVSDKPIIKDSAGNDDYAEIFLGMQKHTDHNGIQHNLPAIGDRTSFNNHAFVRYTLSQKIYDACAGPALGSGDLTEYYNNSHDASTPAEAVKGTNDPASLIKVWTFGEVK